MADKPNLRCDVFQKNPLEFRDMEGDVLCWLHVEMIILYMFQINSTCNFTVSVCVHDVDMGM